MAFDVGGVYISGGFEILVPPGRAVEHRRNVEVALETGTSVARVTLQDGVTHKPGLSVVLLLYRDGKQVRSSCPSATGVGLGL
jgi:hypothetical protein